MIELPRLRPDPIPPIHPVPEYAATDELAARYRDTKVVLQVPWMGVVTMAFAHYPTFFGALWQGTRELCLSAPFVEAAQGLRATAEAAAQGLDPPPLAERLGELGYGARELDDIRAMIEIFSHGNHPYFLLALIARLLLEGGEWGAAHVAESFEGRQAPVVERPFLLMEAHHADEPTRAVYEDVKATLELPFVNTDYRALARWPSYFALAWGDLKPVVVRNDYEARCRAVHDRGLELLEALPNPAQLTSVGLRAAAQADTSLDELIDCTRLFAFLLPGLTVNVAFLRAQLMEG
jgi:hypothetical protein